MQKLDEMLKDYPNDYRNVVDFYFKRSRAIEAEIKARQKEKQKLIDECKERLNAERTQ